MNKSNELISKGQHENKFLLNNVKKERKTNAVGRRHEVKRTFQEQLKMIN